MDSESNPVSRLALDIPRAQRREDALKSLGTAPVIDLTDDDNLPWEHLEVRPQSLITSPGRSCTLKISAMSLHLYANSSTHLLCGL